MPPTLPEEEEEDVEEEHVEPKFECKLQGSLVYIGKVCLSTELWLDFALVLYFTSLALAKSEEETRKVEMQCITIQVQAVKTTTAVRILCLEI